MRSSKIIQVVSAHAEGEVGDVIVGGVSPPPGKTLWEQSRYIARDSELRNFLLNEPRGGVFRHVNLLVPPKDPSADSAFIIMEPEDTPPMSGSNSICVATVLLEAGIIPIKEPITNITLEAPGGLVHVKANCKNGKVEKITIQNLPSFVHKLDQNLELAETGTLKVDIAFGGDSFVIVDASSLDLKLDESEAREIAKLGMEITAEANSQLGFEHPKIPDWKHISFCLFAGKLERTKTSFKTSSTVVIKPGKVDRSPTGTAVSARMAVLFERGLMKIGESIEAKSIIGSKFTGRIKKSICLAQKKAIIPEISGRAWVTGTHQYMLDPDDPWPQGYKLTDTWGN